MLDTFCLSRKFTLHPATLPPRSRASRGLPATWFLVGFGQWAAPAGDWWKREEFIPLAGWLARLPKGVAQAVSVPPLQHSLSLPFLDPAGKHSCLPAALSGTRLASGFLCGPYLAGNLSRPLRDPDIQKFWVTKAL